MMNVKQKLKEMIKNSNHELLTLNKNIDVMQVRLKSISDKREFDQSTLNDSQREYDRSIEAMKMREDNRKNFENQMIDNDKNSYLYTQWVVLYDRVTKAHEKLADLYLTSTFVLSYNKDKLND